MGLPKRVRIVEEDLSEDKAWGLCFASKGLIKIHPYQPMESRMDTLVHELLHMACPDHPDAVAAICPNCHREIHFGVGGLEKNEPSSSW
jgi:hypothetical protein